MLSQTEVGRRWVVAVIVATLTASIVVSVATIILLDAERIPKLIIRELLTIALCVFLYRGANWARLVAGTLFALGGVGALVSVGPNLLSGRAELPLLIMAIIYLCSTIILFTVPTVQVFFAGERVTVPRKR